MFVLVKVHIGNVVNYNTHYCTQVKHDIVRTSSKNFNKNTSKYKFMRVHGFLVCVDKSQGMHTNLDISFTVYIHILLHITLYILFLYYILIYTVAYKKRTNPYGID